LPTYVGPTLEVYEVVDVINDPKATTKKWKRATKHHWNNWAFLKLKWFVSKMGKFIMSSLNKRNAHRNKKATKTLLHLGVKKYEIYMNKKCWHV
jgi:hypothetical protein